MITYKTLSVAEAFEQASKDATWNEAERAALAAIAEGLGNANWNHAYMAGEVQKDGRDWDGTEKDLRPIAGGIQRTARWRAIGYGKGWAKGHKEEFLVSEATEGWNIGRLYLPTLPEVKEALKHTTGGGYAIEIVTEEGDLTRTEVSIWYEDGEILGKGRILQKEAVTSVDCFDTTPEPLSDSFLAEHAEAIVRECALAPGCSGERKRVGRPARRPTLSKDKRPNIGGGYIIPPPPKQSAQKGAVQGGMNMKTVSDFFTMLEENGGAMQFREDYLHTIHDGPEDFSTAMTYLNVVGPGRLHVRQEDWDNWEKNAYPATIPIDKVFDLSGMMGTSLDELDLVDGHYHVCLKKYYPEESRVWWSFNPFTIRRGRSRDGIAAGDCAPGGE